MRFLSVPDNLPAPSIGLVMALDGDSLPLTSFQRVASVAIGSVLIGLLVTSVKLHPAQSGVGTHQQLGLPPCTIQVLFNTRCPACGMTTAWAYVMRGQLAAALRANVGGTLLAGLAIVLGPWTLVSGIRGNWFWRVPSDWTAAVGSLIILGITLIDWGCRLFASWR